MREPVASSDIEALVAAALEKWPRLQSAHHRLGALTSAALAADRREPSPVGEIRADFVLACALAAGDEVALAIFEAELVPSLRVALGRSGLDSALVDDALQVVRFRLLIATDTHSPRIATYRGRSSLRRWLSVVAIREARTLANRARRSAATDLEVAEAKLVAARDLETEHLAREHRETFTRALSAGLASLSSKERLLLRLDVLEGLSDGDIAKIYAVHRTTVLRWIDRAMVKLIETTRRELARALALRGSELESVLRGLTSHLDLSLGRLLAETAPSAATG